MTKLAQALCSAIAIDAAEGDDTAPEWLHLLPAGEVHTQDGRGPYRYPDPTALMAASLPEGGKLVLDENHSTDLAAPKGGEAPARGWIVALQFRADGIWGKIDWTKKGRAMAADREYRGVSPVIEHRKDGTIVAIRRASLTNQPNLIGLEALHQETNDMDFMKKIAAALGLGEDADGDAILAAIAKWAEKIEGNDGAAETAVQSALAPLAKELGLDDDADGAAILTSLQSLKPGGRDEVITGLQTELASTATALQSLQDKVALKEATAFVDGAISAGRVGVKPQRDIYIAMHQEDPARTEKLINGMPILSGVTLPKGERHGGADDESEDPRVIAQHAAAYQKKMADDGVTIDFGAAVRAVVNGDHK